MKKKTILIIILVIAIIIAIYSGIRVIKWQVDNKNIKDMTKKIEDVVNIKEVNDNDKTEIIEQSKDMEVTDPYWDYIKIPLIDVNLDELKKINNETKGWILVNGTNINYPFVQTKNNKYYLSHTFDKSRNSAGWVFLDYRNKLDDLNRNTILYAHGRLDKTMFGSLNNVLTKEWLSNKDNFIVKVSTTYDNTLWQVFSVYKIKTTNDYIQIDFNSDEDFNKFIKMLINRSIYNFNTDVSENDKILTLSTCYNSREKVVLHAKLIKKETK